MRLFKNLFKRNIEEPVDEIVADDIEETNWNSRVSERGPMRVIRLCNPVTGEFFELDLNDDEAFDSFIKGNGIEAVICCGEFVPA